MLAEMKCVYMTVSAHSDSFSTNPGWLIPVFLSTCLCFDTCFCVAWTEEAGACEYSESRDAVDKQSGGRCTAVVAPDVQFVSVGKDHCERPSATGFNPTQDSGSFCLSSKNMSLCETRASSFNAACSPKFRDLFMA